MRLLLLLVILCLAQVSEAVTRYVGKSGSNGNSCATSQSSAAGSRKLTINAGISCMAAGDTLIVGNGVYQEMLTDSGGYPGPVPAVRPPSGSSWGTATIIKAENIHGAIIEAVFTGWQEVVSFGESGTQYISIEGFVFDAGKDQPTVGGGEGTRRGIYISDNGGFVRYQDIRIDYPSDQGAQGNFAVGGWEFIRVDMNNVGYHSTTDANICDACGNYPDYCETAVCHGYYVGGTGGALIDGGTIDRVHGFAHQLYAANVTVRNQTIKRTLSYGSITSGSGASGNLFYNNVYIQTAGAVDIRESSNCAIIGNTVYDSVVNRTGGTEWVFHVVGSNNQIKNNLGVDFLPSGDSFVFSSAVGGSNVIPGNPTNGGLVGGNVCAATGQNGCTNTSTGMTYFVNPGAGDLRLTSTSPARNQGLTLSSPYNVDKDGNTRTAPFDSGAYEFVTGTPANVLAFSTQPSNTQEDTAISPSVVVRVNDSTGALVTSSTANILLNFGANPGSSTALNITVAAVGGIATFPNVIVNNPGTGYTLVATSSGLTSATSNTFNVTAAPAAVLNVPSNLRLIANTGAGGEARIGWDYTQGSTLAVGFTVEKQPACSGGFTARPQMPMAYKHEMSVNLSGAEVGAIPGTHGVDYNYPDPSYYSGYTGQTYFDNKAMNMVRLPFKWERLQPTRGAAFDIAELDRFDTTVGHLFTLGLRTLLVPYNFARYHITGTDHLIGAGTVTQANFVDLWSRLGTYWAANAANPTNKSIAFDLMHEPHTMTTETLVNAEQAAITAIRAAGAENRIYVEGNGRSYPSLWTSTSYGTANSSAMLGITDSGSNFGFAVNLYLDDLTAPGAGECVSATIGPERLAPFTSWLRTNTRKGFVSTWGAKDTTTCRAAIQATLDYLRINDDVYDGWAWWRGGVNISPSDGLLLEPAAGVDKPQMDLMEPFLLEATTVAQTYTESGLAPSSTTCWQVKAISATGTLSTASNTVSWTVPAAPPPPPAPTNLAIIRHTTGHFIRR